jgi:hypothetical protein
MKEDRTMKPEDIPMSKDEQDTVNAHIERIDKALRDEARGERMRTFEECVNGWKPHVLEAVRRHYESEGWDVQIKEEDHSKLSPLRPREPHKNIYIKDPLLSQDPSSK